MTRAELIRMFVLNSFCDDYEDIEQITKQTDELGPKCGLTISHDDIILALRELIELGYAKAWDLTQPKREPIKEYQGCRRLKKSLRWIRISSGHNLVWRSLNRFQPIGCLMRTIASARTGSRWRRR